MKRIKMIVQYLGTNYAGWQVQPNHITVQGEIQKAIEQGLGEQVEIFGSGRTDAGVHAFGQVAHFDTNSRINPSKLYNVINRFLPKDIRVLSTEQVSDTFHARFNVKQKTYEYHFYCSEVNLPLLDATHARIRFPFDFNRALQACQAFVGTHDFKGFCGANTKVKDTIRTIYSISLSASVDNAESLCDFEPEENKISQNGTLDTKQIGIKGVEVSDSNSNDIFNTKKVVLNVIDENNSSNQCMKGAYCLSVTGNGFLYNMVRIIAGTIIEVGCGQKNAEDMKDIIASGERNRAGRTAQPCGLVLKEVNY